jgi:hypothetical protein
VTKRLPVQEKFGLRDHLRQFASSSDSGEEGAMLGMEHPVVIQMRGGDDMLKQVGRSSSFRKPLCTILQGGHLRSALAVLFFTQNRENVVFLCGAWWTDQMDERDCHLQLSTSTIP